MAQIVKNLPAMQETQVQSLGFWSPVSAMGSKTQNKRRSKCSYHLGNYKGFRSSVPATGPEIQSLLSHSDLNKNNFGSMTVTKASLEHVKEGAREERPGWGCTANADHAFERFSKGEGEKWGNGQRKPFFFFSSFRG